MAGPWKAIICITPAAPIYYGDLNWSDEAAAAYRRALALTTNHVKQQYLRKRLSETTP
jgi:hypothetical protein